MAYPVILTRYWWAIAIAFLLLALVTTRGKLSETKGERDIAQAQLSITRSSVDVLKREIDRQMREQAALSQSDAQRVKEGKQAVAVVEAANRVRQVAIDKLNASATVARTSHDECQFSEAVLEVWK